MFVSCGILGGFFVFVFVLFLLDMLYLRQGPKARTPKLSYVRRQGSHDQRGSLLAVVALYFCLTELSSFCQKLVRFMVGADLGILVGGGLTLLATPIIYLQHLFSKFHYQLGSPWGGG